MVGCLRSTSTVSCPCRGSPACAAPRPATGSSCPPRVRTPTASGSLIALWELDPTGVRPARRLTRSAQGESSGTFLRDGSILFSSSPAGPVARRPTGARSTRTWPALWLLPAGGGEARPVAAPHGGVEAVRAAAAADVVLFALGGPPGRGGPRGGRGARAGADQGAASPRTCSTPSPSATGITTWARASGACSARSSPATPRRPSPTCGTWRRTPAPPSTRPTPTSPRTAPPSCTGWVRQDAAHAAVRGPRGHRPGDRRAANARRGRRLARRHPRLARRPRASRASASGPATWTTPSGRCCWSWTWRPAPRARSAATWAARWPHDLAWTPDGRALLVDRRPPGPRRRSCAWTRPTASLTVTSPRTARTRTWLARAGRHRPCSRFAPR